MDKNRHEILFEARGRLKDHIRRREQKKIELIKCKVKFKVEKVYEIELEAFNDNSAFETCVEEYEVGNLDSDENKVSYNLVAYEELKNNG